MAYFPNGSAGDCFRDQCAHCRYGGGLCPIWSVQQKFNDDACNVEVARKILDDLVNNDGTCAMYHMDPERFAL